MCYGPRPPNDTEYSKCQSASPPRKSVSTPTSPTCTATAASACSTTAARVRLPRHAEPLRLNAYVTFDVERAAATAPTAKVPSSFHNKLRDYGYKVIVKEIRWYPDQAGNRFGKADAALDLAVDALLQIENLDRVLLASRRRRLRQRRAGAAEPRLPRGGRGPRRHGSGSCARRPTSSSPATRSPTWSHAPHRPGSQRRGARWARGCAAGATGSRRTAASATCASSSTSPRPVVHRRPAPRLAVGNRFRSGR